MRGPVEPTQLISHADRPSGKKASKDAAASRRWTLSLGNLGKHLAGLAQGQGN